MNELHIPDRAIRAANEAYDDFPSVWTTTEALEAAIGAAAPAIVAAELRRIAARPDFGLSAHWLCARADELDGGRS